MHFGEGISKKGEGGGGGEGDNISKSEGGAKMEEGNQDFLKKLEGGIYLGGHCGL